MNILIDDRYEFERQTNVNHACLYLFFVDSALFVSTTVTIDQGYREHFRHCISLYYAQIAKSVYIHKQSYYSSRVWWIKQWALPKW